MSLRWATGGLMLVLGMMNTGCYYDQWQAEQRANRVLKEDLNRVQNDLQNCEYLTKQKDVEIDSLSKQLNARQEQIASLTVENEGLRNTVLEQQAILKEYAKKGPGGGGVIVYNNALPPALDARLKELAEKYPGVIEYDAKKGAVRWKSDLLFPSGSDQLAGINDESIQALQEFAQIAQSPDAAGFDVIVVGHTDNMRIAKPETKANHPTNWHLSAHRAISVMSLLVENSVGTDRIGIMGYGEYRPIGSNSSAEGRAKNRRVEIYLVPHNAVQSVSLGISETTDRALAFLRVKPASDAGS